MGAVIDLKMLKHNTIYCTDAITGLKKLPKESIDCVMTSPPYWSLRDYGIPPTKWSDGSTRVLGLEPTFHEYVDHLCEVFEEVKRVLKTSGTLWINLGDTYSGSWGNYAPKGKITNERVKKKPPSKWIKQGVMDPTFRPPSSRQSAVQKKSLCLIPERFAVSMVQRGWIARNRIIWHKPNPMPASVKDRFTNSWESLFFFVKSQQYFFDIDAVRIPHKTILDPSLTEQSAFNCRVSPCPHGNRLPPRTGEVGAMHVKGKNPGDVVLSHRTSVHAESRIGSISRGGFNVTKARI